MTRLGGATFNPVMVRRTSPQSKTDDLAFPVRVKIAIPPYGLGKALDAACNWLRDELGPGEFAHHSQRGLTGDTAAFYFRTVEAAQRFVEAFSDLELADGVMSVVYRSPARTSGG